MSARSVKVAVAAAGGFALLGAGWLGASVYSGKSVQSRMSEIAQDGASGSGLAFSGLRHEPGLLSSRGQVRLALRDACTRQGGRREPLAVQVSYEMSHLIGPGGLARFSWKAEPAGEVLGRVFGPEARLSGEGRVTFGRAVESSVSVPELAASLPAGDRGRAGEMRLAATSGRVRVDGGALSVDLGSPRLALQGEGQAVEVRGVALAAALTDRSRGLGTLALGAETFTLGPVRGEGLRLASAVAERGDRIDIVFTPSLREVQAGDQLARELDMEFGLRNLHAPSLRTLEDLVNESCDLSDLPQASQARLREAVGTLLAQGFTAGMERLKGTFRDGAIDGRLAFELRPSAATGVASETAASTLQRRLRASGELTLTGTLLPAPQRQMLVSMGVATESPGGLKAAFDFTDGVLRTNGRTVDAAPALEAIASIERRIAALVDPRAARRDEPSREAGEPKSGDAAPGPGGVVLPAPGGKF